MRSRISGAAAANAAAASSNSMLRYYLVEREKMEEINLYFGIILTTKFVCN